MPNERALMASNDLNQLLRSLPSVEEVINSTEVQELISLLPHDIIVAAVREELDETRRAIRTSHADRQYAQQLRETVAARSAQRATKLLKPSLRRVINAAGVIIHTNLGRSALAEEAVHAVQEAARSYSTLEYNTDTLSRGSRHTHCEQLICALTGAEAAIAVNNNAAAVMMILSEFVAEHEAIISRGELVEIGGSFRMPDIMSLSHAFMVEVGTTNKTHPSDYQRAITDNTSMLLKVHTSNYRLIGFTESVDSKELKRIAQEASAKRGEDHPIGDILVYEDLGSGALLSLPGFGCEGEPTAGEALKRGCDLVSFSGDKLLGGPQAGIIIGSKKLIARLKSNPLARALRLDKMTLAALEATLRLYLEPERARREIPTLRMLEANAEKVRDDADYLAKLLQQKLPADCVFIDVVEEVSRAGGGALPMRDIPTFAVRLNFVRGNAQDCERFLVQECPVPIVGRIKQESLFFDVRTLLSRQEADEISQQLIRYFQEDMK